MGALCLLLCKVESEFLCGLFLEKEKKKERTLAKRNAHE